MVVLRKGKIRSGKVQRIPIQLRSRGSLATLAVKSIPLAQAGLINQVQHGTARLWLILCVLGKRYLCGARDSFAYVCILGPQAKTVLRGPSRFPVPRDTFPRFLGTGTFMDLRILKELPGPVS